MHSFRKAQQPGPVTRLLNCTDEGKKNYKGMDAPTLEVPSMRRHPKTVGFKQLCREPLVVGGPGKDMLVSEGLWRKLGRVSLEVSLELGVSTTK
ncbi:hypothetical protein Godav_018448 [Gossypium davidsonii]|uniref:Uncharacterized protein n=1 Tax=Gossypium davidsonii TaxID=34287 RepID=A0A7J8QWJ4_GOSDV|nr:hypothetical protein [Gossypium davidsonii]